MDTVSESTLSNDCCNRTLHIGQQGFNRKHVACFTSQLTTINQYELWISRRSRFFTSKNHEGPCGPTNGNHRLVGRANFWPVTVADHFSNHRPMTAGESLLSKSSNERVWTRPASTNDGVCDKTGSPALAGSPPLLGPLMTQPE